MEHTVEQSFKLTYFFVYFQVNLNQIVSGNGRYLQNLDNIDSYFKRLNKKYGMFVNDFRTDQFISATLSAHDGAYTSAE